MRRRRHVLEQGRRVELLQAALHRSVVPGRLHRRDARGLDAPRLLVVDAEHVHGLARLAAHVLVHAHDDVDARVDARLLLRRRVLDAALRLARLDHRAHAPRGVDVRDDLARLVRELGRQRLHEVGPAPGVGDARHARLLLDHELRGPRDARRVLRGQRDGLVERVRVQRLGAAVDGGERLQGRARDVVEGLLGRQRVARRLAVRPQQQRPLRRHVRAPEALLHQLGPQGARGPQLGDLDVVVHADGEEEGQALRDLVDVDARLDRAVQILQAVRDREGELQRRVGAGLLHVVARHGDGVEARHAARREAEDVLDRAQRRRRRVDVRVPDHELLEDVVLDRAGELLRRHAGLLGGDDVHGQRRQHGAVHRHRHGHLAEVDAVEQDLHVLDGVDGHAGEADVARRALVVAVVAPVRRQIEGHGQALLPGGDSDGRTRSTPPRSRSPRTGGWSRAWRCTWSRRRRA